MRQLLESIPAARYPEILEYARQSAICPGLPELLDFLDAEAVPFIVVSGGLRGMVETTLSEAGLRSATVTQMAIYHQATTVTLGRSWLVRLVTFSPAAVSAPRFFAWAFLATL